MGMGDNVKLPPPDTKEEKMARAGLDGRMWSQDRKKSMMMVLFFGSVLMYSTRTAAALCMPAMSKEMSWNKKQQGLIMGSFLWGYPWTQVISGYLSDRFGAERVLLLTTLAMSFVTLATPLVPHVEYLLVGQALTLMVFGRVVLGLLQGFYYPACMSWISHRCSETDRTLVYSTVGAGCHGGSLLNGFIGSIILTQAGWQSVFYTAGITSVGWCSYLHTRGDRSQENIVSIADSFIKHSEDKPQKQSFPIKDILKKAPFWGMLIAHFCEGYTFFSFLFWLPSFFHEVYPQADPWLYNALPWIVDMVVSITAGWLANYMLSTGYTKTYTRKLLNFFAMFGFGASLILISFATGYLTTLLFICMAAAGHGFYQSSVIMNPSDIAPNHSGLMFGIMNMFGAIPGFFGAYLSGAILESTHNWNLMFSVSGWVCIVGWAVFQYLGSGEVIV